MSITIKQAFQKLAMVTGAAVKNPWFVGRNLNQAFAEIADNVVDASGDKVTVTQTLTEGTEIGSIKVNNNTTVLYAPAGGSQNYSTTEHIVGKWIDGKDIYEITVSGLEVTLTSNEWSYYTGISGIEELIDLEMYSVVSDRYVKIGYAECTRQEASPYGIMMQATSISNNRVVNIITARYTKKTT